MCTYLLAAELGTSNFSFSPESFSITSPLRSPSTKYLRIHLSYSYGRRGERGGGRGERGGGRGAGRQLPTYRLERWNTGTLEHWNTGTLELDFVPKEYLLLDSPGAGEGKGRGREGGYDEYFVLSSMPNREGGVRGVQFR